MPYVEIWVDDPEPSKEQARAIEDLVQLALECALRCDDRALDIAARKVNRLMPRGLPRDPFPEPSADKAYRKWLAERSADAPAS